MPLTVVIGRLFRKTSSEINRHIELHSIPILLQKDAQFLRAPERKNGNQHFATIFDRSVDFLQEVSFARSLRVSNSRGVSGLGNEDGGLAAIRPGGAQVPIGRHVEVASVENRLVADGYFEHRRACGIFNRSFFLFLITEDMACVIRFYGQLVVDFYDLMEAADFHFAHAVFDHF